MRFVSRFFVSFASALVLLGAFSVFLPSSVHAQVAAPAQAEEESDDPTKGFDAILREGIIFANMEADCVDGICTSREACVEDGQCTLNQILQVFVNITIFILGISGSVILLMFVYGGFLWVTSRGEAKRIEKGKDTVTQAVIGFAIIVLAYSMVNFLIAALAGDAPSETIEETIQNAGDKKSDLDTSGQ